MRRTYFVIHQQYKCPSVHSSLLLYFALLYSLSWLGYALLPLLRPVPPLLLLQQSLRDGFCGTIHVVNEVNFTLLVQLPPHDVGAERAVAAGPAGRNPRPTRGLQVLQLPYSQKLSCFAACVVVVVLLLLLDYMFFGYESFCSINAGRAYPR